MSYVVKQDDIDILYQSKIQLYVKIEVLNQDGTIVNVIQGLISGIGTIDAENDNRRTFNIVVGVTRTLNKISEESIIWLNKDIHIYIGIKSTRTNEIRWWSNGYYVFTDVNGIYNSTTNQMSINCTDFTTKINGVKNGQIGALLTKINVYQDETSQKYNIIKDVLVSIIKNMTNISKYIIDDIGEYKGIAKYNKDFESYREKNETWNCIPFDMEFASGCSIYEIITKLRDLYPNYETFFDEENVFYCRMIPSFYDDDIVLDYKHLRAFLTDAGENTQIDMTTVKNVVQIWGQVLECDRYSDVSTFTNNVYAITLSNYDEYKNKDTIGIKLTVANNIGAHIKINSLKSIPIYDELTEKPIEKDKLKPGVYTFKYKTVKTSATQRTGYFFLQGQFQVQSISVLTDGTVLPDGKFSEDYFKKKYNCETISLIYNPNSPFTVQKIGEILDAKSGNEYENITSDALAVIRGDYELYKTARLTDNVTITTRIIPWLDINTKVEYQLLQDKSINQYIIKSISNDFTSGISTINMYKFYPLYDL